MVNIRINTEELVATVPDDERFEVVHPVGTYQVTIRSNVGGGFTQAPVEGREALRALRNAMDTICRLENIE